MASPGTYLRRKALGLCVWCGRQEAVEGRVHCGYCAELLSEKRAAWRQMRRELGFCSCCGKDRPRPDHAVCDRCNHRNRAAEIKRLAALRQLSGAPVV